MSQIDLRSIKTQNMMSVFKAINSESSISRNDISAKTSLSLMTVGKIVDTFLECGVAVETKVQSTKVGRKACAVSLDTEKKKSKKRCHLAIQWWRHMPTEKMGTLYQVHCIPMQSMRDLKRSNFLVSQAQLLRGLIRRWSDYLHTLLRENRHHDEMLDKVQSLTLPNARVFS